MLQLLSELIGTEMQSSSLITVYRSDCSVINWKTIVQCKSLRSFRPGLLEEAVWIRLQGALVWHEYLFSVSGCKSAQAQGDLQRKINTENAYGKSQR